MPGLSRSSTHDLLVAASRPRPRLQSQSVFRLHKKIDRRLTDSRRGLFVICSASELQVVAPFVSEANRKHRLRMLLVYSDTDATWLPQILDRADLRTIRNMVVHSDTQEVERIIRAWELGAQDVLIARAVVVGEQLLVVSCAGERIEIPFDTVHPSGRITIAERDHFKVADDGSYLWWPVPDVHLDLDSIRALIDPAHEQRVLARKITHDTMYGSALRALREEAGVTQGRMVGLSERQVRRIEKGESMSAKSLDAYARALGTNLTELLTRAAERVSVFKSKRGAERSEP